MNSNFFRVAAYSLVLFFGVRWYLSPKVVDKNNLTESRVDLPGQEFRAPASRLEAMPQLKEIDFDDNEKHLDAESVILYTKNCDYSFSSRGAILSGVEFKRYQNSLGLPVRTIYPQKIGEREGGAFLLALNEKTPLNYFVEDQGKTEDGVSWVLFKAENSIAKISKKFIVSDKDYTLKIELEITPKKSTLQPRILFSGPSIGSLVEDKTTALILDVDGKTINSIDKEKETSMAWKYPTIFGAQDLYFLNAFINKQASDSVQRSFVKRVDDKELLCFVEGQDINEKTSLTYDFYVGPKSVSALKVVNEKLVGVLNFGFLSWFCELFIKFLEWFVGIINSYGLAILLLSLLCRLLILPLTLFARIKSNAVAAFEKMHAGELATINKQFKNDYVKKTEELDKFYTKHGQSQMQKMIKIVGILPEPFLMFTSYRVFASYVSFYHAPLVFWIKDLSAKDPYFVLPILFGLSTIFKEFVSAEPSQQEFGFSKLLMPMILVVAFANSASGFIFFMLCNSVFSALETVTFDLFFARC